MLKALGMSGDYRRSSLWTDFPSRKGSTAAEGKNVRRVLSERRSSRWAERFSALGRKMLQSKRSVQDMYAIDQPDWRHKKTIDGYPYFHNVKTGAVSWEKPEELKTKKEIEEDAGDWAWVPHMKDVWQPAKIIKGKPGAGSGPVTLKTLDGETVKVSHIRMMRSKHTNGKNMHVPLWPLKRSTLNILEDDLVMLEALDEGLLMHVLRERFKRDQIYTWVGSNRSVLVSINPFKQINIYNRTDIDAQQEKSMFKNPPPHVYGIASDSLEALIYENRNQSILISGESGAGKTECTKQCLDFLAAVAGTNTRGTTGTSTGFSLQNYGDDDTVEQKVLVANPVLEAFGNAKTIRNRNSSRFGKWIEVHINRKKKAICGAQIVSYLLERTRVVYLQQGERNYHIFYQLCKNESCRERYELSKPEDFFYLNQSDTYDVENMDDDEEFSLVSEAMEQLDFEIEEQEWLFRYAAGVLHLGNCTFEKDSQQGSHSAKGSKLVDRAPMERAAKYFKVDPQQLEQALLFRSIVVRGEHSKIAYKPSDSKVARDSIAKAVYGRLFNWLVERVNDSFGGTQGKIVGILDIFGFEIFEHNTFEQLCINYCNEKLQQHFNDNTFRDEEELYVIEGINFKKVEFMDNQPVLDLIEKNPGGILLLLDDEGVVPGGTDFRFYDRVCKSFQENKKFHIPKDKKRGDRNDLTFEIDHYAHKVKYNAKDFLIKNSDSLFQDMYNVFSKSEEDNTQMMFPDLGDEKRVQVRSIGNQFRNQLNQLVQTLSKTQSRFIRCIKPNAEQVPNNLDSQFSISQLKSSGVFEAVEIRKTGFPFRYTHQEFAQRYRCINVGHEYRSRKGDWRALCEEILYSSPQPFAGVQFGAMRVMYRVKDHKVLKLLRNIAIERLLPKLQAAGRGYIARKMFKQVEQMEEELADAIDTGNEISELEEAIENCENEMDRIEAQAGICPLPRNLVKAKGLYADLKKWSEVEDEMDDLEYEEPEDVVDRLKKVLEQAEEIKHIPMTSRQEDLLEKMKEMLGTQIEMPEEPKSDEGEDDEDDPLNDETEAVETDNEGADEDETETTKEPEEPEETNEAEVHTTEEQVAKVEDDSSSAVVVGAPIEEAPPAKKEKSKKDKKKKSKKSKKDKKKKSKKASDPNVDPKYKERHERLKLIDNDAKRALAMLDREKMVEVYERARAERHKSKEIRGIRSLLALPEIDFVKKELKKAIEWKDNRRVVHRQIRLKELTLKQQRAKYLDISKLSQLRDPQKFASAKFVNMLFGTEKIAAGMLEWTDKIIPTSLLRLPPYGNKLTQKALLSFKGMLFYMGDRKTSLDCDFHAKVVIVLGLQNPLLRNEIFMQIIKQLTNNNNPDSVKAGWDLMRYCCTAFPPGDEEFENYFIVWLQRNTPEPEDWKSYASAMHAVQYGGLKLNPELEPDLVKLSNSFAATKTGSRYSIRYVDESKKTELIDGQPHSTVELMRGARESIVEEPEEKKPKAVVAKTNNNRQSAKYGHVVKTGKKFVTYGLTKITSKAKRKSVQ